MTSTIKYYFKIQLVANQYAGEIVEQSTAINITSCAVR